MNRRFGRLTSKMWPAITICSRQWPAEAVFSVTAGQRLVFVLQHHDVTRPAPLPLDAKAALGTYPSVLAQLDRPLRRQQDPLAGRRAAITADPKIHDPSSHGRIDCGANHLAARGVVRRHELGLQILLAARFEVHARGVNHAGYHDEAQNWRDWLLRAIAGKARRHARLRETGARRQLQYGLMLALALATTPALAQTGSGLADPACTAGSPQHRHMVRLGGVHGVGGGCGRVHPALAPVLRGPFDGEAG